MQIVPFELKYSLAAKNFLLYEELTSVSTYDYSLLTLL